MLKKDFKTILSEIINDLEVTKTFSRTSLLDTCINAKLRNTITTFNDELDLTTEYLLRRASEKVLKTITKVQKQKDKQELNKYLEEHKTKKVKDND